MQKNSHEIVELTQRLKDLRFEYWLDETLFTFSWWVLVLSTIGVLIVWLILLDKRRIVEIMAYGLMVTITGITLDVLGVSLLLWQYPHPLLPLPIIVSVHIIQMPMIHMIVYQYFVKWKAFLISSTILGFIFAFILEPLLVWLQLYEPYRWAYIYIQFHLILSSGLCSNG